VYILVFNSKGELFVHQRTATKDVFPAHWDVAVGGVLGAGEPHDLGARRELAEELGIEATPRALFPIRYQDEATIVHGLVYRLVHEGPFRLQPEEISHGEFVTLAELEARMARDPFCPDGRAVFTEYQRRIREARP
jgi:isopentenyldiphosphate isomerase